MRSGVVAAILIIIIVAAVVLTVMQTGGGGASSVPEDVKKRPRPAFDIEAKEVVEFTTWEWEKELDRDPETTNYKIKGGKKYAPVMTCASCVKLTAAAPQSPDSTPEKDLEVQRAYKCPLCGKSPYPIDELR